MDGESRSRTYFIRSRDWFVPQALSFGYFSLGKQRKVTRAAQPIGSLASFCKLRLAAWQKQDRDQDQQLPLASERVTFVLAKVTKTVCS
jgi:hypothetical protein